MFKFILKTTLLGALIAGGAVAAFGPHQVFDWVKTSKSKVEKQINEFQGMTAELRKIENRVQRLDREILELKEHALKEELEIGNLRRDIEQRQGTLEHLRTNLKKAESLLNSEHDNFSIQGITYTRREVEQDVAEKMRLYSVQDDTLSQLRQTLLTRENALEIGNENVARGKAVREELTGKVHLMLAQLERYKARQIYAEAVALDFDAREFNTGIGEARQSLAHFERKLEVKNRLLDDQLRVTSESSHVAGIDYSEPSASQRSLQEELAALLNGTTTVVDASSTASVVVLTDK